MDHRCSIWFILFLARAAASIQYPGTTLKLPIRSTPTAGEVVAMCGDDGQAFCCNKAELGAGSTRDGIPVGNRFGAESRGEGIIGLSQCSKLDFQSTSLLPSDG
ncbi:hypothetical protein BDW74DRAFT_158948 [Aspergillus multicolor]|uniref:uncharacterized protein n=1 Tax=Aspergillus multicolor TaxID=41759 RepID=UPI003CCD1040